MTCLFTVGHGTLAAGAFASLLREAAIERVVDVRIAPSSRRHPQFRRESMQEWLARSGLAYRWEKDLGGRRPPAPDSPHGAIENPGFRGYADHMMGAVFHAALDRVLEEARQAPTAVMCAESVWWRCHRRMVADAAVLLRGAEVRHLFHDGRVEAHTPMPEARVAEGALIYDRGNLFPP